jgi:hypothetical protein
MVLERRRRVSGTAESGVHLLPTAKPKHHNATNAGEALFSR